MRVVITGISGLRNRGVEALVVPVVQQLQQRHPNIEIDVLTPSTDFDATRLDTYNVKTLPDVFNLFATSRAEKVFAKLSALHSKFSPKYQKVVKRITSADLIIASGGDIFSSDYGKMKPHLQPLQLALKANIPIVFLAHSLGPFDDPQERERFKSIAQQAKLISVRESISHNYLTQQLGFPADQIHHTADVAFLLQPPTPDFGQRALKGYGLNTNEPIIAVTPSRGIQRFAGLDAQAHTNAWVKTLQYLTDTLNAQVIMVPHVQESYAANDDRMLATRLIRELNYDPRVRIAGLDHTAAEFKGIISATQMVISERMHACIAGLGSAVPTVAVGYSIKAEGIMTDLMGAEFDLSQLVIPVNDFLDTQTSLKKIHNAYDQRESLANHLTQVGENNRASALRNFDLLDNLLGGAR